MTERSEVLVVGGGPVGACAALSLTAAGASVTLIEKEADVCPAVSGAYANCGLLVPHEVTPLASPEALAQGLRGVLDSSSPFYVAPRPSLSLLRWLWLYRAAATPARVRAAMPVLRALHLAGAALHDELAGEHGERWLYHRHGVMLAYESPPGMEGALAEAAAMRTVGVPSEEKSPAQVGERFPRVRGALAGGLFLPEDGHLDPLLFTRAVAELAAAAGAEVRRGTEAIALEPAGRGAVKVITTRGDFVAEQVVLAAGAWTPALTRGLGLTLPIEPAKGYSVDVERPAGFPELPLFLGEAHVVLTPLGDTLRMGSTLELSGWDMTIRPRRVARLRQAAQRVLGLPADGPVRQIWRGPRPLAPDGLPVIGRVPGHERVILATGHCMIGLSLAPVTGRLVAELAGGRAPSLDLGPLSPARFGR